MAGKLSGELRDKDKKLFREVRGQRAVWVTTIGIIVIALGMWVGPAITRLFGYPLASRVQIAYAGMSLLIVFLVLMFGVGSWSRYVPEDSDVAPFEVPPDVPTKPAVQGQAATPQGGGEGGQAHVAAP